MEAIDGLSFHRRTIDGDRWLEVQTSRSNSGNSDQVWGYGRIDSLLTDRHRSDRRLVPVLEVKEKLSVERRRH